MSLNSAYINQLLQGSPESKQRALMGMDPNVKPYELLNALNEQVKSRQLAQGMANQNAMQQPQQPPIAQQLVQASMADSGIARGAEIPEYAGGGIVAFASGGMGQEESGLMRRIQQDPYFAVNEVGLSPYDSPEQRRAKIAAYLQSPTHMRGLQTPNFPPADYSAFRKGSQDVQQPAPTIGNPVMGDGSSRGSSRGTIGGSVLASFNPKLLDYGPSNVRQAAFKELPSLTAEQMEAAGQQRADKATANYDQQMRPFVEAEEKRLQEVAKPRSNLDSILRAFAGGKDFGARRLGESLSAIGAQRFQNDDADAAAKQKVIDSITEARRLRVMARLEFESGNRTRGEELATKATQLEADAVAARNAAEQNRQSFEKDQQTRADNIVTAQNNNRINIAEAAQRGQIAAQELAARQATSSSRTEDDMAKETMAAIEKAREAAKTDPAYLRAVRDKDVAAQNRYLQDRVLATLLPTGQFKGVPPEYIKQVIQKYLSVSSTTPVAAPNGMIRFDQLERK